jgi:hypothetical protein
LTPHGIGRDDGARAAANAIVRPVIRRQKLTVITFALVQASLCVALRGYHVEDFGAGVQAPG